MIADRTRLTLAMARACMNAPEIAKAEKLPLQTVNNVLRGKSVRPITLGKVARALGVDVTELLAKEDS